MFRLFLDLRGTQLALVAAIAVGIWPTVAEAGTITFRNETDFPIMVQGVSIINRLASRGKIHILRPGEAVRELHLVPGPKLIILADAKQPARVLCKEIITFTGTDLVYAIECEVPAKAKDGAANSSKSNGHKAASPRVRLVPSIPTPPASLSPSNPRR